MPATKTLRYAVVGVAAFVIDYGVTWVLVKVSPLLIANTLGFLTANGANFLMAHLWVFEREWSKKRLLTTYLSVLGVSVIGLALNNLAVWAMVSVAGVSLLIGKVVATAMVMAWNFFARLLWIYKKTIVS